MQHLKVFGKADVQALTQVRRFETRIGERVQVVAEPAAWEQELAQSGARFAVVGVVENIGMRANLEAGEYHPLFHQFLPAFLNLQSNDFLEGDDILVLGYLDFTGLSQVIEANAHTTEERAQAYRHATVQVDDALEHLVKIIAQYDIVPVVIGGGQNNAYPLLKGCAKGFVQSGLLPLAQVNAISVSTQAGYGPTEGRHSNNAFRYAEEDGYLEKFCLVGLKENLLTQNTWVDIVNNPFADCMTYEDLFVHEKRSVRQAVLHAIDFTEEAPCGINIHSHYLLHQQADAIRLFVALAATHARPAYLLVSEGLHAYTPAENTGRRAALLVYDFVKELE
jgi:formiminoglutamase